MFSTVDWYFCFSSAIFDLFSADLWPEFNHGHSYKFVSLFLVQFAVISCLIFGHEFIVNGFGIDV